MPGTTARTTLNVVHRCWSSIVRTSSGSRSTTAVPPAQPPTRCRRTSTRPKRASTARDGPGRGLRVGQLHLDRHPPVVAEAGPGSQRIEPLAVAADERHPGAVRREPLDHGPAERARRARDEDDRRVSGHRPPRARPLPRPARGPGTPIQVAALRGLRLEVAAVVPVGRHHERDPVDHVDAQRPQPVDLARVVRHQPHRLDPERRQHVRGDGVVALVVAEPEGDVRLDRVQAVVLQRVGADLVRQADARGPPGAGRGGSRRASTTAGGATPRAGRGSRSAGTRGRRRSGTRSGCGRAPPRRRRPRGRGRTRRAPCRRRGSRTRRRGSRRSGSAAPPRRRCARRHAPCRRRSRRGWHRARRWSRRWEWTSGHQVWERTGRRGAPGPGLVGRYVCGTRRDVRACRAPPSRAVHGAGR